jgi:hypothetical protein
MLPTMTYGEDTLTWTRDIPSRTSFVSRLVALGMLLIIGGLVAGLALKQSADHVAAVANASKRMIPCHGGNPIALCFPKLDHPLVHADYAGLLIPLVVVALGVTAILVAIVIALNRRRAI